LITPSSSLKPDINLVSISRLSPIAADEALRGLRGKRRIPIVMLPPVSDTIPLQHESFDYGLWVDSIETMFSAKSL